MEDEQKIKNILTESARVAEGLLKQASKIQEIADRMILAVKRGGVIYIFGNGGSAADSQHMAAELVGRFKKERRPIPAVALTTDTSLLTAIGNDYGFEQVFSRQIAAYAKKGDIAFAISTSGNSKNVTEAVSTAKKIGLTAIGLTSSGGGRLAKISDICLEVGSGNTARIQEAHITVIHAICELIEDAFA